MLNETSGKAARREEPPRGGVLYQNLHRHFCRRTHLGPCAGLSNDPDPMAEQADNARLKTRYRDEVVPELKERFGYDNVMEVPRLDKVVVNRGVGDAPENQKHLDDAVDELRKITGQHPSITYAKKSIASFEMRKGDPVGAKVTLRGTHMYEFFDRLVTLALPRQRDFRGVPDRSFDGRGNYTLGLPQQIIFPEIDVDRTDRIHGMDVAFVTTAETDEEGYELLKELGMPFQRRDEGEDKAAAAEEERQRAEREAALQAAKEETELFEEQEEEPEEAEAPVEGEELPEGETEEAAEGDEEPAPAEA
jgi:large subunit ribosomal protein L5